MSVDFSTAFGFGYIIPREKAQEIRDGGDKNEYYDYENYLSAINCYDERTNYFFGKTLKSVDAGDGFSVTQAVSNEFDAYAWFSEISEVLEKCGIEIGFNSTFSQPQFLVVGYVS